MSFSARLRMRVRRWLERDLWRAGRGADVSAWRVALLRIVRIGVIAVRGFSRNGGLMRAGSLTYVTIFSLVPLLAVGFAVAKGLGADEALQTKFLEPFLDEAFGVAAEADSAEAAGAAEVDLREASPGAVTSGEGETRTSEADIVDPTEAELVGPDDSPELALEAQGGPQLRRAIDQVFAFVRGTNFTSLGTFSFVFLLYCVLKLLGAVERSLNAVWGVSRGRPFARKVSTYLTLVVLTPMVLVTVAGATALLQGSTYGVLQERLGFDLPHGELLALLPFAVVSVGMTFVYLAMPNTRVRFGSALVGGVLAGFLWQLGQLAHVEFQLGVARINAIYSGFAALPLFLLWVYVNWAVFLFGAEVAHAHQSEPVQTSLALVGETDQAFEERLGLRLALRATRAFLCAEPAPTAAQLALDLGLAPVQVTGLLERLRRGGVLVAAERGDGTDEDPGFLPARAPEQVTVVDVLAALRRAPDVGEPPSVAGLDRGADRALEALGEVVASSPHNQSLATLVRGFDDAAQGAQFVPLSEPSA